MSEHDQKFDLEAQESILKLAIQFDAKATGEASRDDLLLIAKELGISESAVLRAIESYDEKKTLKRQSHLPLALGIITSLQVVAQWAAFASLLYPQTHPGVQAIACGIAFTLALICGRMAYKEKWVLRRLLKLNISLTTVFAGVIAFYQIFPKEVTLNSDTLVPCLMFWLVNVIATVLGAIVKRQGLDPILPKATQSTTEFA